MRSYTRVALGGSLVLAVSVGTTVALATIANGLWGQGLGISEPDRVVAVFASTEPNGLVRESSAAITAAGISRSLLPAGAFDAVAGQVLTDQENAGLRSRLRLGADGAEPSVVSVTPDYFAVLGVRVQGRSFTSADDDPSAEPTAIVSRDYWQRALGADLAIIGRLVEAYPESVRIVGIVDGHFQGALRGERVDVWMPQNLVARFARSNLNHVPRNNFPLLAFAKLRVGVTIADAEALVAALAGPRAPSVRLVPIGELFAAPGMRAFQLDHRSLGLALVITAALVFMCGVVSLAGLAFAAYGRRRHEFAVRLALGATRSTLFRRLATELSLLVLLGGGIGALVAMLALRGTALLALPFEAAAVAGVVPGATMGPSILGAGVALMTVVLAFTPPMWRLLRTDVRRVLEGRGPDHIHLRMRTGLLAGSVAGTTVLAVVAALFLGAVHTTFQVSQGYHASEVMFIEVLTRTSLAESDEMWSEYADRHRVAAQLLERRLKGLAGIEAVAFGQPTINRNHQRQLLAPRQIRTDAGDVAVRCVVATVGPGYVEAMGLTVSAGRGFQFDDGPASAMVSRSLASTLFSNEDAIGRTIRLGGALQVVGVFDDVAFGSADAGPVNAILMQRSLDQLTQATSLSWVVRSKQGGSLRRQVTAVVDEVFPEATLHSVRTAQDVIGDDIADLRLGAWLFSTYGVASLVVAAVGVWALVASLVESRRRELGIRLALGASGRRLQSMLVHAAIAPTVCGVLLGLFGALIVQRVLGSWLFGAAVESSGWYFAGVSVVICAALASALLGARRVLSLPAAAVLRN